jgi:Rrf2 family nitric oxide-sensitive transcriptional repressor
MHLGINRDRLVTIQNIADVHGISKNHLMKVVHQLGLSGMVETVRGRNGGLMLKQEPADINIGKVVRNTETDFFMAECFDRQTSSCVYAPACVLKGVLGSATAAYLKSPRRRHARGSDRKRGQARQPGAGSQSGAPASGGEEEGVSATRIARGAPSEGGGPPALPRPYFSASSARMSARNDSTGCPCEPNRRIRPWVSKMNTPAEWSMV